MSKGEYWNHWVFFCLSVTLSINLLLLPCFQTTKNSLFHSIFPACSSLHSLTILWTLAKRLSQHFYANILLRSQMAIWSSIKTELESTSFNMLMEFTIKCFLLLLSIRLLLVPVHCCLMLLIPIQNSVDYCGTCPIKADAPSVYIAGLFPTLLNAQSLMHLSNDTMPNIVWHPFKILLSDDIAIDTKCLKLAT